MLIYPIWGVYLGYGYLSSICLRCPYGDAHAQLSSIHAYAQIPFFFSWCRDCLRCLRFSSRQLCLRATIVEPMVPRMNHQRLVVRLRFSQLLCCSSRSSAGKYRPPQVPVFRLRVTSYSYITRHSGASAEATAPYNRTIDHSHRILVRRIVLSSGGIVYIHHPQ